MKKDISIGDAFDTYIRAEVVAAGLAKGTHDRYLNSKKIIVSYFGDVPIETLTAESVRDLQEHLLGWQKPDTASGNLTNLRSVVKYCRRKKLDVLDIDDIKIPKRQKRKINYLTEEEVHEFIKVVAQKQRGYAEINRLRNIAIVETLFSSGLRIGELCRLNKNSIQKRQFTVIGKSRDPRICFISNRAEKAISKYMGARSDDNPALFISNQTGKRITPCNIQRVFRFACDRSDFINIHPHTIRHSYATHLLEKEVDIRYIADLLGHQSLDTTKIYTHYSNPKLRSIYEAAFSD